MTATIIKKKNGRVIVTKETYTRPERYLIPSLVAKEREKEHTYQEKRAKGGLQGSALRVHEIKRMDDRKIPPEERVKRLLRLAHELGPEKLEFEIGVHKRKIIDLEEALVLFNQGSPK